MTSALVVDDSTVDRELVKSLLESSSVLNVGFANNGAEALEKIRSAPPAIIITDLHMPQVNGLELVKAVHEEFSSIPIVLITGQGSENLAVEALRHGAASYVPKATIARDLVNTVMHVLAVSRAHESLTAAQQCWHETTLRFVIPNDYHLIAPLARQIVEVVKSMQLFDRTEQIQLSVALEEAVSNALYHGNLELTTDDLRSVGYDLSDSAEVNVIDQRRSEAPYRDRTVTVAVKLNRSRAEFTVIDEGPGFEHANLPSPEAVIASADNDARGLTQIRLFFDEMQFNAKGNQVTLLKRV